MYSAVSFFVDQPVYYGLTRACLIIILVKHFVKTMWLLTFFQLSLGQRCISTITVSLLLATSSCRYTCFGPLSFIYFIVYLFSVYSWLNHRHGTVLVTFYIDGSFDLLLSSVL